MYKCVSTRHDECNAVGGEMSTPSKQGTIL
jgi:hypothetical protein